MSIQQTVRGRIGGLRGPGGGPGIQSDASGNNFLTAFPGSLSGINNDAFGYQALANNTTGSNNSSFGRSAGRANTTGSNNVNVGSSAGLLATTGSRNTRIGQDAQGQSSTPTNDVTAVGTSALAVCAVNEATGIGSGAGLRLTTGVRFTAVGTGAGSGHTTQDAITMIGWGTGQNPAQTYVHNNQTAVGAYAYCDWENQFSLGDDNVSELKIFGAPWARQYAFRDTIIGKNAGSRSALGGARVIIGTEAGTKFTTATDERIVTIGALASNNAELCRAAVYIGDKAGQNAYNNIDVTVVGSMAGWMLGRLSPLSYDVPNDELHIKAAGADVTHGGSLPSPGLVGATFMGKNAGRYNTIGLNNTGIGDSALGFTTVGGQNVAVGYVCGEGNVSGSRNTWVGHGVRVYQYNGDDNVQMGYRIGTGAGAFGTWVSGGSRNSNVGTGAVYSWRGDDTTSLGFETLRNITAGTGGDVAIGARAGHAVTTGGANIFVGQDAGYASGSQLANVQNSIAIGSATFTEASNQTVIGNSSTTHTVLRGSVGIGLALVAPSGILHTNAPSGTTSPLFSREVATSDFFTVARHRLVHSGDMADGFGPGQNFVIRDNAGVDNVVASIGAVRRGADNTGEIQLRAFVAGASNDYVVVRGGQVVAAPGSPPTPGGTLTAGLCMSSTANFGVFFGSGAPTISAAKGSLYMRSDGSGPNSRMYVNTDGGTTWTHLVTGA